MSNQLYKYFDMVQQTVLHTDACNYGYGAVLLQISLEDNQLHPVYYWSRKTSITEQNYSSYKLEVLANFEAAKRSIRVYLLEQQFKLVTDCKAFTQILEKKRDLITKVARWSMFLEQFN